MSKEFVYNDNEVCVNPNELLIMEKPKDWWGHWKSEIHFQIES